MAFNLFWDTVSIISILHSSGPIRSSLERPKTNYIVNFSDFSTTISSLDLRVSLSQEVTLLKVTPRILESFFILRLTSWFLM